MKKHLRTYIDRAKKIFAHDQVGVAHDFAQGSDWHRALMGTCALGVILFGVSFYEFMVIGSAHDGTTTSTSTATVVLEKDDIMNVLTRYHARADIYNELKINPQKAPQPASGYSIPTTPAEEPTATDTLPDPVAPVQ